VAGGVSQAAIPATLVESVAHAAAAGITISPRVLALVQAFGQGTFISPMRAAAAVLLTLGLVSGVGFAVSYRQSVVGSTPPAQVDDPRVENAMPKADLHGDPLPEGAPLRFGTVRFRHPRGVNALAL